MSDKLVIHDVTLPISESLTVWPGDPPVQITQPLHLDRGDPYTVSRLNISAHTGTHIDAPIHFFRTGRSVEALDLQTLIGQALVVENTVAAVLSAETLELLAIPPGTQRVLFRTGNSVRQAQGDTGFCEDFVAVAPDGARWLVEHGLRLVGIDYLSVGGFSDPSTTHRILLEAGVIIVEGLNLQGVRPGVYQMMCLPLKIAGGDGAPARVVLIQSD
jgi:arylformamidase